MKKSEELLVCMGVVAIGCGGVTQTGINSNLGHITQSTPVASLISFATGTAFLAIATLSIIITAKMRRKDPSPPPPCVSKKTTPLRWFELAGGVCGATAGSLRWGIAPSVGYSLAFVCMLVGQLCGSLVLDHIGFLGMPRRRVTGRKIIGVMTVLAGGGISVAHFIGQGEVTAEEEEEEVPMPRVIALCCVLVCGGGLYPTQACINARLNRRFAVKTTGSLVSFTVGLLVLTLVCAVDLFALEPKSVASGLEERLATSTKWWNYCGGFFGVFFVTGAMILSPRLGVAMYLSCVICGQLLFSMVLDSIGAFGFQKRPLDAMRVFGVCACFAGSVLIRWPVPSSAGHTPARTPPNRYEKLNERPEEGDRAEVEIIAAP